eukprot:GCRY01000961.1.p1 GENE.GCRY01000961.1~~GCRY01000961.1.p1  ORF type:complete len:139 (+),score=18.97 GCRY01000961.1:141-557(+)
MDFQDWNTITVSKDQGSGPPQKDYTELKHNTGVNINPDRKFGSGGNKQKAMTKNSLKLDQETEELHHDRVDMSLSKRIQQARLDKKMTQKELAQKINEKPQVVNEYEAGKAIPNPQILGKMERILGVKLRGKPAPKKK